MLRLLTQSRLRKLAGCPNFLLARLASRYRTCADTSLPARERVRHFQRKFIYPSLFLSISFSRRCTAMLPLCKIHDGGNEGAGAQGRTGAPLVVVVSSHLSATMVILVFLPGLESGELKFKHVLHLNSTDNRARSTLSRPKFWTQAARAVGLTVTCRG